MEAISMILDYETLTADFKTSFSLLDTTFDKVRFTIEHHGQSLGTLKLALEDLSQCVSELENACSSLCENNSKLTAKVIDLEAQSRRLELGGIY